VLLPPYCWYQIFRFRWCEAPSTWCCPRSRSIHELLVAEVAVTVDRMSNLEYCCGEGTHELFSAEIAVALDHATGQVMMEQGLPEWLSQTPQST